MKVTSFVLPAILVALGFSTTQAGLFDVNLLERLGLRAQQRKDRGPASTISAIYLT